ncbi:hypothetical protein CBN_0047 [Clostridium botulinum NCTC 2916]|uniref:Uncharacterized protein n=1 Tax=Clostridium botulinum (strain Kyoto / Type A2) TaxID=536232 RepID=C1FQ04_CLOBJ|nr:hypothetical protein CLK_3205 [Clostridium botulinum A3 str. Loch Maree]ACO85920.1 hypothetical protein CLM_0076 [Clostridium botulinum A2 str. Kyoto]EDT79986.1 hypothetical protein CBN_0047 [Clostridium botulinum NCTC 2916]
MVITLGTTILFMLSEGNGVEYIYKQFQINYEKLLVCV